MKTCFFFNLWFTHFNLLNCKVYSSYQWNYFDMTGIFQKMDKRNVAANIPAYE